MFEGIVIQAFSGIFNRHADKFTGPCIWISPTVSFRQDRVFRLNENFASIGHGITGIYYQIHYYLLYLAGIRLYILKPRIQDVRQFDVFADNTCEHLFDIQDYIIEVDLLRPDILFSAEGQKLAG